MMPNIDRYHLQCGPQAAAALARCSADAAAHGLLGLQRVRGRWTAPGTSVDDLALFLASRGLQAEPWRARRDGARPTQTSVEFLEEVNAELVADMRPVGEPEPPPINHAASLVASLPEPEAAALTDRIKESGVAQKFTLREWLSRPGRWLLIVDATYQPGLSDADAYVPHALAAADGVILSGDTSDAAIYGTAPLREAYKVTRS